MLDDGTYKAICKHCKKYFVVGNRAGTSHLKYHIGVCPKIQLSKRRKYGNPKLDIPTTRVSILGKKSSAGYILGI